MINDDRTTNIDDLLIRSLQIPGEACSSENRVRKKRWVFYRWSRNQ